ncbi:DUF302 domain-containing protein [Terribacillus goriensis]|uniref:DUF302 domain-containing protein n=1 Tax=Terribacillus saccharophilus TaxID=361277 RepID=UPI003982EF63
MDEYVSFYCGHFQDYRRSCWIFGRESKKITIWFTLAVWHQGKAARQRLGIDQSFRVLEVCDPFDAQRVLQQNQLVGYFLPCKIVVYESDSL